MSRLSSAPPVLLALGATLALSSGHAQQRRADQSQTHGTVMALRSVSIELPQGDRMFPPGPGSEAITNNCLGCHSAGMVLNQPALPRAVWEAEVHKMVNVYKAPVVAEDVPAIVGYLDAIKGTKPGKDQP